MLSKWYTLSLFGLKAEPVEIEVDVHRGLPAFTIVGLPDASIQESRERIRTALKNSHYGFPKTKLVVNLAPADLKKQGPRFDLPIALGILASQGQIPDWEKHKKTLFIGELGFSGELRRVSGVLPTVAQAVKQGYEAIVVPDQNAEEASLIPDITIYSASTLREVVEHLQGDTPLTPLQYQPIQAEQRLEFSTDMSHIKGNEHAKRALEIAAAGGHNLLMNGPPGSGKTMLAKAFVSILPRVTLAEALQITQIYSVAGLLDDQTPIIKERPFRSVHHTASGISIVGGGNPPKPGEISLAHRGVLFLDEMPEFNTKTLEVLRQPLEDGHITVSRASGTCSFPAQVMLVAAMNPCPCGFTGDPDKTCQCSPFQITRYQSRLSGPLLDRIDLHISVPRVPFDKLSSLGETGETSLTIRQRVEKARDRQQMRFAEDDHLTANADMDSAYVKKYCLLDTDSQVLLKSAVEQMQLSGRAYYRILKIARTIADLSDSDVIEMGHVAEAISYRERTGE